MQALTTTGSSSATRIASALRPRRYRAPPLPTVDRCGRGRWRPTPRAATLARGIEAARQAMSVAIARAFSYGRASPDDSAGPAARIVAGARCGSATAPILSPSRPISSARRRPGGAARAAARASRHAVRAVGQARARLSSTPISRASPPPSPRRDAELRALAAAGGGLFAPRGLELLPRCGPLPQAHLARRRARSISRSGPAQRFIAIELEGSASPRKQRREELARLEAAGVALVRVPGAALQQQGERLLAGLLPPPFQRFWEGVTPAREPVRRRERCRARSSRAADRARHQSVISMT